MFKFVRCPLFEQAYSVSAASSVRPLHLPSYLRPAAGPSSICLNRHIYLHHCCHGTGACDHGACMLHLLSSYSLRASDSQASLACPNTGAHVSVSTWYQPLSLNKQEVLNNFVSPAPAASQQGQHMQRGMWQRRPPQ